MKIKQSTFYALRLIYRMHTENAKVITSVELAEKEGLSLGVSIRILRELVQGGIMDVHQGRGQICGGFSLTKSIDEITMLEVVAMFEGLDICTNIKESDSLDKYALLRSCRGINDRLRNVLADFSIRDLFESEEVCCSERKKGNVIQCVST